MREVYRGLKIPKATYEGWETHRFPRTPEAYGKLAEFLGVSLEYLMLGKQTQNEKEEAYTYFMKFISKIR